MSVIPFPREAQRRFIEFKLPIPQGAEALFATEAMQFVAELEATFGQRVRDLLAARARRAEAIRSGETLDFLPGTKTIREGNWEIAGIPADLQNRRVEITGPVDRKMVINALNSGANVFMADFEDSLSPTWENIAQGQVNLYDAVRRTISFTNPDGKEYTLNDKIAVLVVRPRGWHLPEPRIHFDRQPMTGALVDFGLYFYHNAQTLLDRGTGPYFYLPKLESHEEAALWRDIFAYAEEARGLARGTIKCTVLIETITAAFEMDEILYELKDYIVAQNAGRWDYIFSYIKKHAHDPAFLTPERNQITMTQPFMEAYWKLLIQTCHKRGALAMGGMAAFIPVKDDAEANANAFAAVRKDKTREVENGHDGTWVAHPGLIPLAREIFDEHMPKPNQLENLRQDVRVTAADLLEVPEGTITEAGLRNTVSVPLQYLAAWLDGNGCVPINHLMEDAATAEISRTQLWQWITHGAKLEDGRQITEDLFRHFLAEEIQALRDERGDAEINGGTFPRAAALLEQLVISDRLEEFLTLPAMAYLEG